MRRPRAKYRGRAHDLLRTMGLGEARGKKPAQLSGGMRQRVSICRALIGDPEIMLMDEPFSALDAITRDEMNVLLLDLWERYRKTALFVTHSIREAVLLSDRVLVMGGQPSTHHRGRARSVSAAARFRAHRDRPIQCHLRAFARADQRGAARPACGVVALTA